MEQYDLLGRLVRVLEALGVRYFVTGSMATMFYGEPRFTNDIAVVVELPPEKVREFCAAFPEGEFYVSEEAVRDAIGQRGQFNIIHPRSGMKVDVMLPTDTPFNRSRFARVRRVQPVEGCEAAFASPEDAIIKKMEYYREGGSDKHLRDIASVLKIVGDELDHTYIAEWASDLGLIDIWQAIVQRIEQGGDTV